jgi:hypothetical protein
MKELDKSAIVDLANESRALMDGTIEPVKRIIEENEVVFGVWQDDDEPDGVGILLIKGQRRLGALAESGKPAPTGAERLTLPAAVMKVSAIPCLCLEQAEAARLTLGEDD